MVTLECVEKLIRKDMVDPVNGDTLTERDIIVLQRVSCHSLTAALTAARTPSWPALQTVPWCHTHLSSTRPPFAHPSRFSSLYTVGSSMALFSF